MPFTIRECKSTDAPAICALNREELGYDYPLEETAKKLEAILKSKSDRIFVAEAENTVIGYVHACNYDVLYAPHMKNIMGIAVRHAYRRQGVGKALLEQTEAWARKTNAKGIRLVSGSTRKEAHAFYRRLGYSGGREQLNFKKYL